jgi:hypothetical protein
MAKDGLGYGEVDGVLVRCPKLSPKRGVAGDSFAHTIATPRWVGCLRSKKKGAYVVKLARQLEGGWELKDGEGVDHRRVASNPALRSYCG